MEGLQRALHISQITRTPNKKKSKTRLLDFRSVKAGLGFHDNGANPDIGIELTDSERQEMEQNIHKFEHEINLVTKELEEKQQQTELFKCLQEAASSDLGSVKLSPSSGGGSRFKAMKRSNKRSVSPVPEATKQNGSPASVDLNDYDIIGDRDMDSSRTSNKTLDSTPSPTNNRRQRGASFSPGSSTAVGVSRNTKSWSDNPTILRGRPSLKKDSSLDYPLGRRQSSETAARLSSSTRSSLSDWQHDHPMLKKKLTGRSLNDLLKGQMKDSFDEMEGIVAGVRRKSSSSDALFVSFDLGSSMEEDSLTHSVLNDERVRKSWDSGLNDIVSPERLEALGSMRVSIESLDSRDSDLDLDKQSSERKGDLVPQRQICPEALANIAVSIITLLGSKVIVNFSSVFVFLHGCVLD